MCGIAAIINKSKKAVDEQQIKQMTDIVVHRGPDGEGHYLNKNIALGHRRLSIIDLSDAGKQPMIWKEKFVITFNGEIYNYLELKKELSEDGYSFSTHTDTEVILAAYEKWGNDCFNRFNGMWAIVIFDVVREVLVCSRDRFGVKPMYYFEDKDQFLIASEIKQILPFVNDKKPNYGRIGDYLFLNVTDHTNETFFKDIFSLRGGNILMYDLKTNNYEIERFYEMKIDSTVQNLSYKEAKKEYSNKFLQSINLRLRSDVPVGTCLSGGLDSSFIASTAAKIYKEKSNTSFKAITASSIDPEVNELKYAKQVVDYCDLDWKITEPSYEKFWMDADEIMYSQEEPFGNPTVAMQYYVMQTARNNGVVVLLDGQGGDETLLGYSRYVAALLSPLSLIEKIQLLWKFKFEYGYSVIDILKNYLWFSLPYAKVLRAKWKSRDVISLVKKEMNWDIVPDLASKYKNVLELQKYELLKSQIPQLLKWEDKNSMRFSIETRLPFLDYNLVEFALALPHDYKNRNGYTKYIVRDNMENLVPDDIRWRKNKFGFNAPLSSWLKESEKMLEYTNESPIIKYIFQNKQVKTENVYYLWRLYNLAKWSDLYKFNI
jgi:asparagine synthase (glutamine-hydrolysing)